MTGHPVHESVALLAPFQVVVGPITVEVVLYLGWFDAPSLAAVDLGALIEKRVVHSFEKSVGSG